jgi:hypothetical protein
MKRIDPGQDNKRWGDISKAPKDGSNVLVWDNPMCALAFWDTEERGWGGKCWKITGTHEYIRPTLFMLDFEAPE